MNIYEGESNFLSTSEQLPNVTGINLAYRDYLLLASQVDQDKARVEKSVALATRYGSAMKRRALAIRDEVEKVYGEGFLNPHIILSQNTDPEYTYFDNKNSQIMTITRIGEDKNGFFRRRTSSRFSNPHPTGIAGWIDYSGNLVRELLNQSLAPVVGAR
ncbi:MAG TPA: hypothetical protein VG917_03390 [Patescibacteria group bacterium]|nr:hypothetical protein [Patescibacteria group bacterium]